MPIRSYHPIILGVVLLAAYALLAGYVSDTVGHGQSPTTATRSAQTRQIHSNANRANQRPRPQTPPNQVLPAPPQQGVPPQTGGSFVLTPTPRTVSPGELVKFDLQPADRVAAFPLVVIDYGDNSRERYRPGITHQYTTAGLKDVTVWADFRASMLAQKPTPLARAAVEVNSVIAPPTPEASPTPAPTPPATPSPSPSPTPSPSPSPTPSPSATPDGEALIATPTPSNSPFATPEDSTGGTSGRLIEWVKQPRNWLIILAALVVPFVGYRGVKKGFAPRPTFHCAPDAGNCDVNDGMQSLAIAAQVILSPNIRDADYQITTGEAGLVKKIRRHDA